MFHINKIIQHVALCGWLLLLSITFSRSIHTAACTEQPSHCGTTVHCMDTPRLVCSSVDGHLGCFHYLATGNNAAVNIQLQVFVWTYISGSFECIPWSGIAGSYCNLNCLRSCQTVSHVAAPFYIPASNGRQFQLLYILASRGYHLSFLFWPSLWMASHLVSMCISLLAGNVKHLFRYLLAICMFSLQKSLLNLCSFLN